MKIDELIELLDEGLLVVDSELKIVLRNQAAWHRFGFSQDAKSLLDAVGSDQQKAWHTIIQRADKDRTFRTTIPGPDSNSLRVYACSQSDGNTLIALRRPHQYIEEEPLLLAYAQALAHHGIGLWRIDIATGELWWSSKCYELLGIPEGPISTGSYLDRLSEEDQATIGEHIHREITGAGVYAPCFQVEDGGQVRHMVDRTQLLFPEQAGSGPVYVGAARDRTREAELEARCAELEARLEATEAVRESSQLAGAVAHDLNNVMMALIGNAELLILDQRSPRFADHLDAISVAARHASALSGRMLDFVRKRPLSRKVLDVADLAQENLSFLKSLVPESVQVAVQVDGDAATVSGDRHQLEQALYNLVLNAGQAAAGNAGRVVVSVQSTNEELVIAVEDNGRGMSPKEQDQLFEPFYTTRAGGAGLGLCSVRQVVDNHGGSVAVTSSPGAGARFEITLPRCADEAVGTGIRSEPSMYDGVCIWIADDNNMVRLVLEQLLLGAQYQVRSFARSADLLAALDQGAGAPDLVITDLVMPEMSGLELFEEIRSRLPEQRVLFMSGYTDHTLNDFQHQAVAANLLNKPFERRQLISAIEDTLAASPINYEIDDRANLPNVITVD